MSHTAFPRRLEGMKTIFGLLLAACAAFAQQPAPPASAHQLVLYRLGPKWQKDLPMMQQPGIADHAQFMGKLMQEGTWLIGGPVFPGDGPGDTAGMMILKAASPAEARKILANDPAGQTGIFEIVSIQPLRITGGTCIAALMQQKAGAANAK